MDDGQAVRNILFNSTQLQRLIINLHTLTGIWANIFDGNGRDIQIRNAHSPFCQSIHASAEGDARCKDCDIRAVQECRAAGNAGIYPYHCHAGLREYLLPIFEGGVPIAYLVFGQLLDESSRIQQWERTKSLLDWYDGDMEQLRREFFRLRQCSREEITAFAEVLEALASYIQLEGIIRSAEYTDVQKLEMYLDQHYMEPLSLQRISTDLHMGTTKLCALAKKFSDGKTVTQLISLRRVNAAKKMLISSNCPISDVAGAVGFSDYNYFTRIFKANTGMTPRAFRKSYEDLAKCQQQKMT